MGQKRKRPQKSVTPQNVSTGKKSNAAGSISSSSLNDVEHPVLSRYYRRVITLRHFLQQELPLSSKSRRRRIVSLQKHHGDGNKLHLQQEPVATSSPRDVIEANLARLLDSTLVGILDCPSPAELQARQKEFAIFSQSDERSLLCTDTGPCNLQSEVVDYVISHLFRRNDKPQHVLANGFGLATRRQIMDQGIGALAFNIHGVVMHVPNPHVMALKTSPWTDVLSLLGVNGEDIMSKLLIDCGVFSCIDHEKAIYRQISGTYLSELKPLEPKESAHPGNEIADKSLIPVKASNESAEVRHKPNSIVFVRRRMLYARPAANSKGGVRFGLRHIHVLNRFPDPNNLADTVHVMKYIFPRQFGLHNVFTSEVNVRETVQPFKDYTLREEEINDQKLARRGTHAMLRPKIPKRLRGRPMELVQKLQKRSQNCPYTELLKHYCPATETGPPRFPPFSPETREENVSQTFVTQVAGSDQSLPFPKAGDRPQPTSQSSTVPQNGKASRKVCFLDYSTPCASVSAFCRATLRRLIPKSFFGEGDDRIVNERQLMYQIDRFVRLSRFESLSLHEVCKGFRIKSLRWLDPSFSYSPSTQHNIALSDLRKRTEILHEFIYYIFDSLLIPLIRTNFYVTESQVHKNRLFYFRHDVWRSLVEQPLTEMKSSMFEEIKRDKVSRVLSSKQLSWSAIRLLPKSFGTRPIINLRRRVAKRCGNNTYLGPSTNSTMTPVFNALLYEKERNPELLGSSMFSVNDMYPRLKAFKDRLMLSQRVPQLYFVKLDIQSCFDTIPQRSLISLIESLVTQAVYHISKHVEVKPGEYAKAKKGSLQRSVKTEEPRAKPIRRFFTKAKGLSEVRNPTASSTVAATTTRKNTIQVDISNFKNHSVDALLDLLSEHVRKNLVKIGKKYFRQKNGIPQGSILSSLLCNFFYGKLEREVLTFLDQDDTLLLRLIDDFLLITADPALAKRFLSVMLVGQPDYGITVNPSKSLVNFEATINGVKMPRLEGTVLFPYCGNLIDTHTLDIRKDRDYGRGGEVDVADTLTVEFSRQPGQAYHRKVLSSLRLQTHSMFLDTHHNSVRTVAMSIYSSFVETAIKMYRYIKFLQPRLRPSPEFVLQTIRDVIHFGNKMIQSKQSRNLQNTKETKTVTACSDTGLNKPEKAEQGFQCAISPAQIEYLGAAAFRHILSRKQTQYRLTLEGLEQIMVCNKPRTNKEMIRTRWIIKEANKMFDNWRY